MKKSILTVALVAASAASVVFSSGLGTYSDWSLNQGHMTSYSEDHGASLSYKKVKSEYSSYYIDDLVITCSNVTQGESSKLSGISEISMKVNDQEVKFEVIQDDGTLCFSVASYNGTSYVVDQLRTEDSITIGGVTFPTKGFQETLPKYKRQLKLNTAI
jgi:hypothetical protein